MSAAKAVCSAFVQRVWYRSHPLSRVLSSLLLPLSALTAAAVGARRAWYRRVKPAPAPLPVIVVGNLTVGGTGKTPLVAAIARRLQGGGRKPGIVSRGYGARCRSYPRQVRADDDAGEVGDEPLLLRQSGNCPVVIDPDRRRAVACLVAQTDADVAICDDGLQHYRLHRDVEIAVVDGRDRFGNGRLLPAGPLREPASRLNEVDIIVVSGAGEPMDKPGDGEAAGRRFFMQAKPLGFENLATGEHLACDGFAGRTVHACAGIARPQRFFDALSGLGVEVHAHAYPDHHRYRAQDLRFEPGTPVVVTGKDAVKCRRFADDNVWSLQMEAVVEEGFWTALDACLARRPMQPGDRRQ